GAVAVIALGRDREGRELHGVRLLTGGSRGGLGAEAARGGEQGGAQDRAGQPKTAAGGLTFLQCWVHVGFWVFAGRRGASVGEQKSRGARAGGVRGRNHSHRQRG